MKNKLKIWNNCNQINRTQSFDKNQGKMNLKKDVLNLNNWLNKDCLI